ncbi:GLPGLI family protein [Chryseobacterium gotjawalense]|uniref:GLPGLI family protein n=1 Tax=Chryseobacterium gotjawalense TaxID=3042315 RepID=A0ABY8RD70_9FLAO|nr:GLPGLI family protein [Chryseobacterium sp. wdc7]WHF51932.1 GLPGLI family protein [Chryseobacterium sp. wdc7]
MQKLFFIFFILLPFSLLAQTHRFIYSYQFVPDSTKVDSIITENTRLEVFKDHSEFLSDIVARRDSAIVSAIENNQSQSSINLPDGKFKNKAYKSKKLTYTIENIGIQPFKVVRKINISWKLLNETKKIQGYNCQKAITYFGNRKWEAWFTAEIPIQDGPYIFGNLPGLIIQMYDLKNHHSFLLVENYKTANTTTNLVNRPYFIPLEIQELQFIKKWNEFRKNPIGGTEQFMLMNPNLLSGKRLDENGNEVDMRQQKREEQKYAEKQLQQNNNFIDLTLYK